MNGDSKVAVRADRKGGMLIGGFAALAAVATLLVASGAAQAGGAAASAEIKKGPAVTFESIPGTTAKRVILTAKSAERLGIETGRVREDSVVRKQMVGGLVVPPLEGQSEPAAAPKLAKGQFGGFGQVAAAAAARSAAAPATPPAIGDGWLLVTLSQGEWDRVAKDELARVLPLATREGSANELLAMPSGMPPVEDSKRSMLSLYYLVPGKDRGLTMYQRVRVELKLSGGDEKRKIVPYSSVYYDATGSAWVYVNPKPLTFERQRVDIERVEDNLAILTDGPSVGTSVVTVGAAMLYGAEIFGK